MNYLRQNSAVSVILGPFVSYLSGATNLDSVLLTGGTTPAFLHANTGTTQGLANNAWELISGSSGNYRLGLSAINTTTTGAARVSIAGASLASNSFLEVFKDFQIVTQNFYDGIFGDDTLNVSATTFGATNVSDSGITIAAIGSASEHQQYRAALGITGTSTATTGDGILDFLYHIQAGGWTVGSSGSTMQFFKNDNSTVVATFDLFDSEGGSTYQTVFQRTRSS